jgi:hypothetical protein
VPLAVYITEQDPEERTQESPISPSVAYQSMDPGGYDPPPDVSVTVAVQNVFESRSSVLSSHLTVTFVGMVPDSLEVLVVVVVVVVVVAPCVH